MITITITRSQILHIVEGISATIGQHNNGGATAWQALWASASESPKLDIWWREAIADLELAVNKWAQSTSSQFNLSQDGSDYTITLDPGERWSSKLSGLLANKIQSFMVHYVVSGWLSDFKDVQSPNYQEMAAQDLDDVTYILVRRNLDTQASARHDSSDIKADSSDDPTSGARHEDVQTKEDDTGSESGDSRHADTDTKADDTDDPTSGTRHADADTKADSSEDASGGARRGDTQTKSDSTDDPTSGARHEDVQTKENTSDVASGVCRDKDDEYFDEAPMYTAGASRDKDDVCKAVCMENPFNGRQGIGTMVTPRHYHGL